MFTRKKSIFKRKSFYITLVAIFGVAYLMFALISAPEEAEAENIAADVKKTVTQNVDDQKNSYDDKKYANEENDENNLNNTQENETCEYYLVKESDGIIKVYQYDSEGNESLLRTTDILFSMLGKEDQELFSEGVIVKSEDELLELLQDFES
ncbi:MAG: hypothetical protein ACK5MV_05390 [Aminipila sp.]